MKEFADVSKSYIMSEYKQISIKVKEFRKRKGYTQEYVALSMGFTTATFYTNAENFKSGKHFNLEHIIKISKILNIPISHFFESIVDLTISIYYLLC